MTRALGPNVGIGHQTAMPFAILGLCWLPIAGLGAVWVAGHSASSLTGRGWTGPDFGFDFATMLVRGGLRSAWPSTPPSLIWSLAALIAMATLTPVGFVLWRRRDAGQPGDAVASLARVGDVAALTPDGVTARTRNLRASVAGTSAKHKIEPVETGVALGRLMSPRGAGPVLRASWEDVVLAVMAPRAGKTTALAVPTILDAPGPVVATSNKTDLWAATAGIRATSTGQPVWVFDPQHITGLARTWWWNPLRGVTTVAEANRLAGHFIQEVRGNKGAKDFWTSAAGDLLTGLVLAAGLSGGSLVDVYEWLNDPVLPTPVQILREHGETASAASMLGRQHGAPETRDGVYETARTAAQCLRDGAIMTWVTPASDELEEFDATGFPTTRQSLYLLSKDGAGAAAPLVAALTDRVMREAVHAAERAGGRLDPPMVVVLDEAANVCRIADLPELYSHLGSRGVLPITILQSYRQGTRVWGDHGMDALWSAATCKVIGAGLDDARLAEDISRLVGDHDVSIRSISRGDGRANESISLRRQRILPPEQLRALPRGQALLLATGCRAALLRLMPWFESDRAGQINEQLQATAASSR